MPAFYSDLAYEIVFETTGVSEAFNTALAVTRPSGTVVAIGFIPRAEIDMKTVTFKALKVLGSIGGTEEFPRVLRALKEEPEYFKKLITARFHYSEFMSALETAAQKSKALKVQIHF